MLLQFPSEPSRFRSLRLKSVDGFRTRCRAPVIRRYGPTTEDLGGFLSQCRDCDETTGRLSGFSDLDPELSLGELEEQLGRRASHPSFGWRPEACETCGSTALNPVMAVFGRYLGEAAVDMQIELVFGAGRIVRIEHAVMDDRGNATAIERPQNEAECLEAYGVPLSLRALWREFIDRHLYDDVFQVRDVQAGYVVGTRPFTDDHRVAARQFEGFPAWLELIREHRPHDAVTFLRDREEDQIPIAYEESYHAWLARYAHDIGAALIDPFIVADSDTFVATLARQAAFLGLQVRRDSNEGTLFVRFWKEHDLDMRLNLGPCFFKILHEGRTFHRGLRRHFDRELQALASAAGLPEALRTRLPAHRIEVVDGSQLQVGDGGGVRYREDLVHVATRFDYRTTAGMSALLTESGLVA